MTYSITNNLAKEEVAALAHFNSNRELIAINLEASDGPKIVKLSRDEVTCWQLFLRLFNCGTLAKMQVHLRDVAAHLNQYDWSEAKILSNDSELYQAYRRVSLLANKAVLYKRDETLFNNVGLVNVDKTLEHTRYRGSEIVSRLAVRENIKWNPSLQVKHVKALMELHHSRLSPTTVRIEDNNHHVMSGQTNVTLDTLHNMRIYLEQREPAPQPIQPPRPKKGPGPKPHLAQPEAV